MTRRGWVLQGVSSQIYCLSRPLWGDAEALPMTSSMTSSNLLSTLAILGRGLTSLMMSSSSIQDSWECNRYVGHWPSHSQVRNHLFALHEHTIGKTFENNQLMAPHLFTNVFTFMQVCLQNPRHQVLQTIIKLSS